MAAERFSKILSHGPDLSRTIRHLPSIIYGAFTSTFMTFVSLWHWIFVSTITTFVFLWHCIFVSIMTFISLCLWLFVLIQWIVVVAIYALIYGLAISLVFGAPFVVVVLTVEYFQKWREERPFKPGRREKGEEEAQAALKVRGLGRKSVISGIWQIKISSNSPLWKSFQSLGELNHSNRTHSYSYSITQRPT